MTNSKLLLVFSLIGHYALPTNANDEQPLVPSMYIFGDSVADCGNNNYLNTPAKANWPYGIDFNNKTGRFTNGKNGADFLAEYLHLPLPQPYLNLSDSERSQANIVVNYASGSCGILNTTRAGECLSLAKQVEYFTLTATKDLPKAIKNPKKLCEHLAESIYLLLIGNNDYFPMLNGNITDKFSPENFADYLIDELTKHIKTLYDLGARKIMVSGLSICEPHQYTPKQCESRYYSDKIPQRLQDLQKKLPGLLYSVFDGYEIYKKMFDNPNEYGMTHVKVPCYVNQSIPICLDRSKYNQFDKLGHQTEASFEIASKACFYGTACTPNLQYLASQETHQTVCM